jgi:hypothetical protein
MYMFNIPTCTITKPALFDSAGEHSKKVIVQEW